MRVRRGLLRLPRRSLLAALFFFSLSSSLLYFVYVAPGIGRKGVWAPGEMLLWPQGRPGNLCPALRGPQPSEALRRVATPILALTRPPGSRPEPREPPRLALGGR